MDMHNMGDAVGLRFAGTQSAEQMSRLTLETALKLLSLNMAFAERVLADAVESTQKAATIKSPLEFLDLQRQCSAASAEQSVSFCKASYQVAHELQSRLIGLTQEQLREIQSSLPMTAESDDSTRAASEPLMAAIRSAIAATSSVLEHVAETAEQSKHVADATVDAVVQAARQPLRVA